MTSLPSRRTEIFFPSPQARPSEVTTCVPLIVVSTWDHLVQQIQVQQNQLVHLQHVPLEPFPGNKLAIQRAFQALRIYIDPRIVLSKTKSASPTGTWMMKARLTSKLMSFASLGHCQPPPKRWVRSAAHLDLELFYLSHLHLWHKTESSPCKCPLPIFPFLPPNFRL